MTKHGGKQQCETLMSGDSTRIKMLYTGATAPYDAANYEATPPPLLVYSHELQDTSTA